MVPKWGFDRWDTSENKLGKGWVEDGEFSLERADMHLYLFIFCHLHISIFFLFLIVGGDGGLGGKDGRQGHEKH